jgi:glycosyltransferase involved in cell wall biosynthesis
VRRAFVNRSGKSAKLGAVPLVSIVLIFLNEERYLEEAVQSVTNQTFAHWELILVDDGSTDRSTHIARDLAVKDDRIRYVDHPWHQNRGMSASRNLGVAQATAPYIAFLDADDVWMPDNLAEQVDLLQHMPDVAMVVGAMEYWHSWDPASAKPDRVVLPAGMAAGRLEPPDTVLAMYPLRSGASPGVIGLIRRGAFDAVGGYDSRFRGLFEDQAFRAKIFLRYPIYISSRSTYRYRQHDESCCQRTSHRDYVRLLGNFLDWFEEDGERLRDTRVSAAVRRARIKRTYLRVRFRLTDPLPTELKKRIRAACSAGLSKRIRGHPDAH